MTNHANSARKQPHSEPPDFPAAEAPSFFSRPTPVVPANDDLKRQGTDHPRPASGEFPVGNPSSRPTYCPDDPNVHLRRSLVSDDLLASVLDRATVNPEPAPTTGEASPAPEASGLAPDAPFTTDLEPEVPPRRRAARAVFVLLFGGVLTLLGYTFSPRIVAVTHVLQAKVMRLTAHH